MEPYNGITTNKTQELFGYRFTVVHQSNKLMVDVDSLSQKILATLLMEQVVLSFGMRVLW